jgi:hypothetical protein
MAIYAVSTYKRMETMKGSFFVILFLAISCQVMAQEKCLSTSYQQEELRKNPLLRDNIRAIEEFTAQQESSRTISDGSVIKIPVVVHILYHTPEEKISDAQVMSQINALNLYFRRRNEDTINAPAHFRAYGADTEIEFRLATSDPKRRSTSGIIRKYTPITKWKADDKMKFASSMGDDAWDPSSYLNIWVCNLDRFAGYATLPGGELSKDGVVIAYNTFGASGGTAGYTMGKTAVHEVGHWLNLKHIWGDENCGDDGVSDTPKQASYTVGCPKTARVTCGNGPYGDMYMNFMDYTNDDCINMFTYGQKARMRALFAIGGVRRAMTNSKGLDAPLIFESLLPEDAPKWLHAQVYPNPASTVVNIDLAYDERWVGKTIFISNLQGQNVMNVTITTKRPQLDISRLTPGIYFLAAKKDDGESIKLRFIKL